MRQAGKGFSAKHRYLGLPTPPPKSFEKATVFKGGFRKAGCLEGDLVHIVGTDVGYEWAYERGSEHVLRGDGRYLLESKYNGDRCHYKVCRDGVWL